MKKHKRRLSIFDLPNDCLSVVFEYIGDNESFLSLRLVNKQIRDYIHYYCPVTRYISSIIDLLYQPEEELNRVIISVQKIKLNKRFQKFLKDSSIRFNVKLFVKEFEYYKEEDPHYGFYERKIIKIVVESKKIVEIQNIKDGASRITQTFTIKYNQDILLKIDNTYDHLFEEGSIFDDTWEWETIKPFIVDTQILCKMFKSNEKTIIMNLIKIGCNFM